MFVAEITHRIPRSPGGEVKAPRRRAARAHSSRRNEELDDGGCQKQCIRSAEAI